MVDMRTISAATAEMMELMPDRGDDTEALIEDIAGLLEPLTGKRKEAPAFVHELVYQLEQSHGQIVLSDVYRALGHSARHIGKTFERVVGIRPKQFARTRQLNFMFELLSSGKFRTFTDIAFASGYVDQPYFIKAVRQYIDASPTDVISHPDFAVMFEYVGGHGDR